jgi:hypothetical protein
VAVLSGSWRDPLRLGHSRSGDLVDAHPTVGRRRNGPLGSDLFGFQQALQGRVQRALFHLEQVVGALLDVLNQRISMRRLAAERFEDHHLQGAGKEIAGCVFHVFHKALKQHA